MDMGGGAGGGKGMLMPPPTSSPDHPMGQRMKMMMMHMTFFWGEHTEILFSRWPGDRGLGIYLLALTVVLALAAAVEVLSAAFERLSRKRRGRAPAAALLLALLHAMRLGLAYLVMLAVMSFNGGVLIAAVAGHALGFLLSRSGLPQGEYRDGGEFKM